MCLELSAPTRLVQLQLLALCTVHLAGTSTLALGASCDWCALRKVCSGCARTGMRVDMAFRSE